MGIEALLSLVNTKMLSGLIQAQDFKIPQPSNAPQGAGAPAQNPMAPLPLPVETGPSTTEIVLGVVAALAAVVVFYLLRGVVYTYLIERRVKPSAARGAGWAFFTFLLTTVWLTIAGFVVGLWSSIPFLIVGAVAVIATLLFFLASFFGALKKSG